MKGEHSKGFMRHFLQQYRTNKSYFRKNKGISSNI